MSRNLISLSKGVSTWSMLNTQLDRIESETGYRPVDWLTDIYDEAYEEYMQGDSFDWDGFGMHLSCVADSFIEFIHDHYQHLNMTM